MQQRSLVGGFAVAAILTATGCSDNSADDRLRELLAVAKGRPLTEDLVAERVGKLLPVGTSEPEIAGKASAAGIGKDALSSYTYLRRKNLAVIRIEFDRSSFALVKSAWIVSIRLDSSQKLESVSAQRHLTGL
jgi:hypothetical protein